MGKLTNTTDFGAWRREYQRKWLEKKKAERSLSYAKACKTTKLAKEILSQYDLKEQPLSETKAFLIEQPSLANTEVRFTRPVWKKSADELEQERRQTIQQMKSQWLELFGTPLCSSRNGELVNKLVAVDARMSLDIVIS